MITEILYQTASSDLNLATEIKLADLNLPQSIEDIGPALTEHVIEGRHCLAVSLCPDVSLPDAGCGKLQRIFSIFEARLRTLRSLELSTHLSEDVIEEYCLNGVSDHEAAQLEQHLAVCEKCADQLRGRREFIQCLRAALKERPRRKADQTF